MRNAKDALAAALLALLLALLALAAGAGELSLTLENDCFVPAKSLGKGDHDYTHGTGIEYADGRTRYKAGQNMYAPSDLKRSDHIDGDRPYAGMIYAGVGREFSLGTDPRWTHYGEIDFGMIGPAAFAGHTQKFIHKVLGCRDPKGWHNQLHNEFVVNGQWWEKYNWYLCDWVALVPRAGIFAGTVQDAVEVGCDLKVGWNIRDDAGNNIMFSSARGRARSRLDDLQAYVYAGADERFYLYNHLLEGSFIRSRDRDQHLDVDIERFVGEVQLGACVRYGRLAVRYYLVLRQDEFRGQKHSPNYGGLVVGWTF